MAGFRTLADVKISGRTVLVRVDLNVPMHDGEITDTTRIDRVIDSLRDLSAAGAKVVVLSHFGRPKGKPQAAMSLKPLQAALAKALRGIDVGFVDDCVGPKVEEAIKALRYGHLLLLENLRFHPGEEANDPAFADQLAGLGDIYVNDAFSCSHRAHASITGLAERLPAVAGPLMQQEIEALSKALEHPKRPVMAVIGGAKISTKLELLGNLLEKVDVMILGGGMANTFLAAQGTPVGKSLCEHDMLDTARKIMAKAKAAGCDILLPIDGAIAKEFKEGVDPVTAPVEMIPEDGMMLDIGPHSAEIFEDRLAECRTVVWNGPLGAFELAPFDAGTTELAIAAAEMTKEGKLLSIAGGGDTVAALANAGVLGQFSYISTAGGAFLEWLEGKELPGVAALRQG
ncbi:MAG: phosphoglycerate kinase [Rhizobiales bacterium]|nr:phosphoglycerate kinase [Hyphomicrobiales bacterium]